MNLEEEIRKLKSRLNIMTFLIRIIFAIIIPIVLAIIGIPTLGRAIIYTIILAFDFTVSLYFKD